MRWRERWAELAEWSRGRLPSRAWTVPRLIRGGPAETLGRRGEEAAARALRAKGFQIVARSDRGRLGELDLVAVDGETVVFVEVKTRRSHDAGHPADAVDEAKQQRLTRLALAFLKRHGLLDHPARFDVVAVTWPVDDGPPGIEHYRGAFTASGIPSLFS